ncbi:MAG TPA: inositol monophosphatase family protein [Candidatus Marinimicrobia bacterium]|jgi:myo-inositol-1(or 4)-monophosphatase|nr:inositol monophosphatase family protein [Candidatus Neomarinimicrobiota bacterium]HJM69803.1 inositol monophosphatase family protein [Candidatus Neomarinimicrobiota bacterium]|tara:strand:- start:2069 stop:2845 length:777 start_codon:yes stop_codon:yes gene_type:complete
MNNSSILDVAISAAQGAADIILSASKKSKIADYKGRIDLVTKTDKDSEEFICNKIKEIFPDHGILAEESGSSLPDAKYQWIIDPLDGTTNFVHDYPSFGVSICIMKNEEPIVACVVELPVRNIYTAIIGQGAFCNNEAISVSSVDDLEKSLYVTGFGYEHGERWERNMILFKRFTDIGQGVRRLGAAAVDLCHIASGKVDGFWEFDLHPWDTAAGILIVSEAGGKVTKLDGSDYSIYNNEILATNGEIHQKMINEIQK